MRESHGGSGAAPADAPVVAAVRGRESRALPPVAPSATTGRLHAGRRRTLVGGLGDRGRVASLLADETPSIRTSGRRGNREGQGGIGGHARRTEERNHIQGPPARPLRFLRRSLYVSTQIRISNHTLLSSLFTYINIHTYTRRYIERDQKR